MLAKKQVGKERSLSCCTVLFFLTSCIASYHYSIKYYYIGAVVENVTRLIMIRSMAIYFVVVVVNILVVFLFV